MWFHVDPATARPLYQQIMEEIRSGVEQGALAPGERLPSVRQLSLELTVNPNTVARAYLELERQGWITTARGAGTFVADNPPLRRQDPTASFRAALRRSLAEAARLGLDHDQVSWVISEEFGRWFRGAASPEPEGEG